MDREMFQELADDKAVILDGLDDAILGIDSSSGSIIYDEDLIFNILMTQDGMDEEEALDHYGYNILGSVFTEYPPIFLKRNL